MVVVVAVAMAVLLEQWKYCSSNDSISYCSFMDRYSLVEFRNNQLEKKLHMFQFAIFDSQGLQPTISYWRSSPATTGMFSDGYQTNDHQPVNRHAVGCFLWTCSGGFAQVESGDIVQQFGVPG